MYVVCIIQFWVPRVTCFRASEICGRSVAYWLYVAMYVVISKRLTQKYLIGNDDVEDDIPNMCSSSVNLLELKRYLR